MYRILSIYIYISIELYPQSVKDSIALYIVYNTKAFAPNCLFSNVYSLLQDIYYNVSVSMHVCKKNRKHIYDQ